MFRSFVRGILFATVLVAIFFVIRERPSSWTLILLISMVSLVLIRKEKFSKDEHSRNADEVENQEKQNISYPLKIFEITDDERSQFAVAIATSFALGNVYVIENEIEISGIAGGYNQSLNSREPRPGRIGRVTLNSEEPLVPYEVFGLLCTKYLHSVDSEFLRKIAELAAGAAPDMDGAEPGRRDEALKVCGSGGTSPSRWFRNRNGTFYFSRFAVGRLPLLCN